MAMLCQGNRQAGMGIRAQSAFGCEADARGSTQCPHQGQPRPTEYSKNERRRTGYGRIRLGLIFTPLAIMLCRGAGESGSTPPLLQPHPSSPTAGLFVCVSFTFIFVLMLFTPGNVLAVVSQPLPPSGACLAETARTMRAMFTQL